MKKLQAISTNSTCTSAVKQSLALHNIALLKEIECKDECITEFIVNASDTELHIIINELSADTNNEDLIGGFYQVDDKYNIV